MPKKVELIKTPGFVIEVPQERRKTFFVRPKTPLEYWAFKNRPRVFINEQIIFTFGGKPVAEAIVVKVEPPGHGTGEHKQWHKVYWKPSRFRKFRMTAATNKKFFHGTKAANLDDILKNGLKVDKSAAHIEWHHAIYLACDAYTAANYEGMHGNGEPWVILEIDGRKLREEYMRPDDYDFPDLWNEEHDENWAHQTWQTSLKVSCQIAYLADIPPSAIKVHPYKKENTAVVDTQKQFLDSHTVQQIAEHFRITPDQAAKAKSVGKVTTASGKHAAEDEDYYMVEGCGIYAVELARKNGGEIYVMSADRGEEWSDEIPYEVTHAFVKKDGKTFDIRGERTPDKMAWELSMGDYSIKGPWTPDAFEAKFMGSGDDKPLYGNTVAAKKADWGDEEEDYDPSAEEDPAHYYAHGACFVYAVALNKLTGWPIFTIGDPEEGAALHSVVKKPNGKFFDSKGESTLQQLGKRYGLKKPFADPITPEGAAELALVDTGMDEEDFELKDALAAARTQLGIKTAASDLHEGSFFWFEPGFPEDVKKFILKSRSKEETEYCEKESRWWANKLAAAGFEPTLVKGDYKDPDNPDIALVAEHWWVEVGGKIFDPTAVQFGGESPERKRYVVWDQHKKDSPLVTDPVKGGWWTHKKGDKIIDVGDGDQYWAGEGNGASGILPVCPQKGTVCLAWRSQYVMTPHCWGTIGGAIQKGKSPQESAKAELAEETGYSGGMTLIPAYVFTDRAFSYHNFIGVTATEFSLAPKPFSKEHIQELKKQLHPEQYYQLNPGWETDHIEWVPYATVVDDMNENPEDYHPGMLKLFKNSKDAIERALGIKDKGEPSNETPKQADSVEPDQIDTDPEVEFQNMKNYLNSLEWYGRNPWYPEKYPWFSIRLRGNAGWYASNDLAKEKLAEGKDLASLKQYLSKFDLAKLRSKPAYKDTIDVTPPNALVKRGKGVNPTAPVPDASRVPCPSGKKKFFDEATVLHTFRDLPIPPRAYKCPMCGWFHLTSKPQIVRPPTPQPTRPQPEPQAQWPPQGVKPLRAAEQTEMFPNSQDARFRQWFDGSKVVDKQGRPMPVYHGTRSSVEFDEFAVDGPPQVEDSYEGETTSSGSGSDPTAFIGAHFAEESNVANQFAQGQGWTRTRYEGESPKPRVIQVFLRITNPKDFGGEENLRNFIYQGSISEPALDIVCRMETGFEPWEETDEEGTQKVEEFYQNYKTDQGYRTRMNESLLENYRPMDMEDEELRDAAYELAMQARGRLEKAGHDGVRYKNIVEGGHAWIAFAANQIKSAWSNFTPNDPRFTASKQAGRPERLTPEEVFEYINDLHREGWEHKEYEDLEWIKQADYYELQEVLLGNLQWGFAHPPKVHEYAELESDFPPIVVDAWGAVIDGFHRATAARQRGEQSIMAYVGVEAKKKEAAPLHDEAKSRTYYHGTDDEAAAQAILSGGIQPREITMPDKAKSRAMQAPVPDRVYLTDSIDYAAIYAMGGQSFGMGLSDQTKTNYTAEQWLKNHTENGQYGYIFEVQGADLAGDVMPDEDSIGEALAWIISYNKDTRRLQELKTQPERYKGEKDGLKRSMEIIMEQPITKAPQSVQSQLLHMTNYLTPNQVHRIDEAAVQAQVGKKLQKRLTPDVAKWLLDNGAHMAHQGAVFPTRAWRFSKKDALYTKNWKSLLQEVPIQKAVAASADYEMAQKLGLWFSETSKEADWKSKYVLPTALALGLGAPTMSPHDTIPTPISAPAVQEKQVSLDELVEAIRRAEGADPDLHNPGNLVGFHSGEIMQFETDAQGVHALKNALKRIADGKNPAFSSDMTLEQAGAKYSNGDPNWAKNVSQILGVDLKTPFVKLIRGKGKVAADLQWLKKAAGFAFKSFKKLWHVGTMNPKDKRDDSYEGAGLSVSVNPEEWSMIAKLPGSYWEFTKPGNKFVNFHRLSAAQRKQIVNWGVKNGYAKPASLWRHTWYNEEIDDWQYSDYATKAEAEGELGGGYDEERVEPVKGGLNATPKLSQKSLRGKIDPTEVMDLLVAAYAEDELDCDGVWWDDMLDPENLSAPRGVIFPSKLPSWKKRKMGSAASKQAMEQYLYHGTNNERLPSILQNGMPAGSFWGTEDMAFWFSKGASEEEGLPVVLRLPLSRFNQSALAVDNVAIQEPITEAIGRDEEELYAEWQAVPGDGTWQDSLRIYHSVKYNAPIKIEQKDVWYDNSKAASMAVK